VASAITVLTGKRLFVLTIKSNISLALASFDDKEFSTKRPLASVK